MKKISDKKFSFFTLCFFLSFQVIFQTEIVMAVELVDKPTEFNEEWTKTIGNTHLDTVYESKIIPDTDDIIIRGKYDLNAKNIYYIARISSDGTLEWFFESDEYKNFLDYDISLDGQIIFVVTQKEVATEYNMDIIQLNSDNGEILKRDTLFEQNAQLTLSVHPTDPQKIFISCYYEHQDVNILEYNTEDFNVNWNKSIPNLLEHQTVKEMIYVPTNDQLYVLYQNTLAGSSVDPKIAKIEPSNTGSNSYYDIVFDGSSSSTEVRMDIEGDYIYLLGENKSNYMASVYDNYLQILDLNFDVTEEFHLGNEEMYYSDIDVIDDGKTILFGGVQSKNRYEPESDYIYIKKCVFGILTYSDISDDYTVSSVQFFGDNEREHSLTTSTLNQNTGDIYITGLTEQYVAGETIGYVSKYSNFLNIGDDSTNNESGFFDIFSNSANWGGLGLTLVIGAILGAIIGALIKKK